MNLKSIVDRGWNAVKKAAKPTGILIAGTYLVFNTYACDLFNKNDPVEKVTITNETPVQGSYSDKHKGDTQQFKFDSNSELGLPITEFYRVDGTKVDNDNEYTHTFNRKGVTTIQGIAKTKEDSAKVTWIYSVENQAPVATSKTITSDEESTTTIPESELGYDPDGDNLEYTVTNTSGGIDAKFENGNLVIEREKDYFGNASVNYSLTDGEATATGKVNDEITNVPDNPKANAGTDQTGTIDEEITLNGKDSYHPDTPLSNITQYLWKALNDEGNINITNADQENAKLTANTRGSYDIELTVEDNLGAIDKDTVNVSVDSYKILVNTTNVLDDLGIAGLEVMLAGKTAFTNNEGQATLEYPTNVSLSGNLQIQDENIEGSIGDFFNYSDSISVNEDKELNIEMIPNVEFNSQYYDNIIEFMIQMHYHDDNITINPGDYPEDYPILVNTNESEMPADYYKQAVDEAIEKINNTLGWEVYKKTTGDDARYIFDYSKSNSSIDKEHIQKNGLWYIDTATIYILNAATVNGFEILKGEITHELFTHGTGFHNHSSDKQDISSIPVWDSDITQNEKNAVEINLKLKTNTDLDNYQPE